jgi:isopentenyldiphosphate isomerase
VRENESKKNCKEQKRLNWKICLTIESEHIAFSCFLHNQKDTRNVIIQEAHRKQDVRSLETTHKH